MDLCWETGSLLGARDCRALSDIRLEVVWRSPALNIAVPTLWQE